MKPRAQANELNNTQELQLDIISLKNTKFRSFQ